METAARLDGSGHQPAGRFWPNAAAAAVVALAAATACTKVWNFDTFWHLKSGQWMFEHRQVLRHDPFSVPEEPGGRPQPWVNVHWGFQLIVTAVHGLAGFGGLVVLKMAVFAGAMAVPALWLRRRIAPAWLMLAGLGVILCVESRARVRPEVFTFALLAATIVLVESVREGASPARLWWLVPINAAWVNMHGLYLVGPAVAWAAAIGALVDRALRRPTAGRLASAGAIVPLAAATAAVFLISPWPVTAALHPFTMLRTRVSGAEMSYRLGVSEFMPTYQINPFRNVSLLAAMLLALVALEGLRHRRRQAPLGHFLWYVMFLVPAVTAMRNVALFGLVAGYLAAVHGGGWIAEYARRFPRWRAAGPAAAAAMLLLLAAAVGGYATEWVFRWQQRRAVRFGLGLSLSQYPVGMARWLGECRLDGAVMPLDFGEGGTFIYHSYPRRQVWMDGRLEVHSKERFERLQEYRARLLSPVQATELPLPREVRFIAVRFNDFEHIRSLRQSPRFQLVYVDQMGACFARTDFDQAELPPADLGRFDLPLDPAAPAPLLKEEPPCRWWRQNATPAHWELGAILYCLGTEDITVRHLALRFLTAAERLGEARAASRIGMLAEIHQRFAEYQRIDPDEILPVNPNAMRALALYEKINLSDLSDAKLGEYALVRVRALAEDRQIDAADKAMRQYLEDLPIPRRWRPSRDDQDVYDSIRVAHNTARVRWRDQLYAAGKTPLQRAEQMIGKEFGLIDAAVAELEAHRADLSQPGRVLLGDLYLRKGLAGEARKVYAEAGMTDPAALAMRRGLCDWAEGDFAGAIAALREAGRGGDNPAATAYLSLLLEHLGHYADAAGVLAGWRPTTTSPADQPQVEKVLAGTSARLAVRGYVPGRPGIRNPDP